MPVAAVAKTAVYAKEVAEGDCLYTVEGETVREVSESRDSGPGNNRNRHLGACGERGPRHRHRHLRPDDCQRKDCSWRSVRFLPHFHSLSWAPEDLLRSECITVVLRVTVTFAALLLVYLNLRDNVDIYTAIRCIDFTQHGYGNLLLQVMNRLRSVWDSVFGQSDSSFVSARLP